MQYASFEYAFEITHAGSPLPACRGSLRKMSTSGNERIAKPAPRTLGRRYGYLCHISAACKQPRRRLSRSPTAKGARDEHVLVEPLAQKFSGGHCCQFHVEQRRTSTYDYHLLRVRPMKARRTATAGGFCPVTTALYSNSCIHSVSSTKKRSYGGNTANVPCLGLCFEGAAITSRYEGSGR